MDLHAPYSGVNMIAIEIVTLPSAMSCPSPPPALIRQADGSYVRIHSASLNLVVCYSKETRHWEIWGDLPENGGKYLYTIPSTEPVLTPD